MLSVGRLRPPVQGALLYGLAAIFAVTLINRHRLFVTLFALITIAVLFFAIYLTYSRGAWVGLIVSFAVIAGLKFRGRGSRLKPILAAVSVFVVLTSVVTWIALFEPKLYYQLIPRGIDFRRADIWSLFLQSTWQHFPFFGAGALGTPSETGFATDLVHGHNIVVSAYYYSGLPGVVALLALMFKTAQVVVRDSGPQKSILFGGIVAYGFSTLAFDGGLLVTKLNYLWIVFWLPILLASCLDSNQRRTAELL